VAVPIRIWKLIPEEIQVSNRVGETWRKLDREPILVGDAFAGNVLSHHDPNFEVWTKVG